jgi:hypothetical protein
MVNQVWPGIVCTQLSSLPAGGVGPKYTSTEPSAGRIDRADGNQRQTKKDEFGQDTNREMCKRS